VRISLLEFFSSNLLIEEKLSILPPPANFKKTVYVMHSPLFNTRCDVLSDDSHARDRATISS